MKKVIEATESYTFRIPSDIREKLQKKADAEGRTLSNYIIFLLRKAVDKK